MDSNSKPKILCLKDVNSNNKDIINSSLKVLAKTNTSPNSNLPEKVDTVTYTNRVTPTLTPTLTPNPTPILQSSHHTNTSTLLGTAIEISTSEKRVDVDQSTSTQLANCHKAAEAESIFVSKISDTTSESMSPIYTIDNLPNPDGAINEINQGLFNTPNTFITKNTHCSFSNKITIPINSIFIELPTLPHNAKNSLFSSTKKNYSQETPLLPNSQTQHEPKHTSQHESFESFPKPLPSFSNDSRNDRGNHLLCNTSNTSESSPLIVVGGGTPWTSVVLLGDCGGQEVVIVAQNPTFLAQVVSEGMRLA